MSSKSGKQKPARKADADAAAVGQQTPHAKPHPGRHGDQWGDRLSPKQTKFIAEYLATGNASEAYRRAYDTKRMKPATINRNAKKLLDTDKIATRIADAEHKAIEAATLTRQWIIERMMLAARIAMGELPLMTETLDAEGNITVNGGTRGVNLSEARQILTQLGKIDEIGLFVDRAHVKSDVSLDYASMTDEELLELARELEGSLIADGIDVGRRH